MSLYANIATMRILVAYIVAVAVVEAGVLPQEELYLGSLTHDGDIPSSHKGSRFLIAFMPNAVPPRDEGIPVPDAYIVVTTWEDDEVWFDVTTSFNGVEEYNVTRDKSTRINFDPDTVYTSQGSESNKTISVVARNGKKIAIFVVNDEVRSTDGYLAFPCDGMVAGDDHRSYNYIVLSAEQDVTNQPGSTPRSSQFVVITCEDQTKVIVRPSTTITLAGVFDDISFGPGLANEESDWEVSNNNRIPAEYTLTITQNGVDLTGTVIKADKPIVVISGHMCGQIPEGERACDLLSVQIPPHATWGYTFLLSPLSGRQTGDYYRFATLLDSTQVNITCVDAGGSNSTTTSMTLNAEQGSNHGTFETHPGGNCVDVLKYCCLQASNPVIVAQYSYGHGADEGCGKLPGDLGDPFMILIPPVVQYLYKYIVVPVDAIAADFTFKYLGVSVYVDYFQPEQIWLDDALLQPNPNAWQAIYCHENGVICGYTITIEIDNEYHTVYHGNSNASLFVNFYGFSPQNSLGVAGGMQLEPISGTVVYCDAPTGCVEEGTTISINCTRSQDLTPQSRITVNTKDWTAVAPDDYTPINDELINYSGGRRNQETLKSFDVVIATDAIVEPLEEFLIHIAPTRTVIVWTPWIKIYICGVGCPLLPDPANGMVMLTGTSSGDMATYSCDPGSMLVGSTILTCGDDSMWSDDPPVCEPMVGDVMCPDLDDIPNGAVMMTGNSVDDTATYTCDMGYELVGVMMVTCQSDGMWDNPPPVCRPLCPDLTDPANGAVMMTGNSVDDTATYTCDMGYELVGVMTVTCQSDGMWDNPPPECTPILCPSLTDPANGAVMMTGNSVDDTATYTCDMGYELVGVMTVTCQSDGTWDNPPPICSSVEVFVEFDPTAYNVTEGVDDFANLMLVRSGDLSRVTVVTVTTVSGSATAGSDYTTVTMDVTFGIGSASATVQVPIIDDNTIEDPEIFTASLSTTQTNVMFGDDTATITIFDNDTCPCLDDIPNGSVSQSGKLTGDIAMYFCDEGYELVGAQTLTCQENGMWDNLPPMCVPVLDKAVHCSKEIDCSHVFIHESVESCCVTEGVSYRNDSQSICDKCYVYGWMKDIALDLQTAEPLTSIDSSEGNKLLLYVYFTRNGPSHTDDILFTIHTSGTAQEGVDYTLHHPTFLTLNDKPLSFNVSLLSDGVSGEGLETITLTLVQNHRLTPSNQNQILQYQSVVITIQDADDRSQSSNSVSITVISVVTALLVLGILLATVIAIICQRKKKKRKGSTYNPNHICDLPDYSQFKNVEVEPDVKQQGVEGNSGADCEMETNIAYGLSASNRRGISCNDNAEECAEMVPQ